MITIYLANLTHVDKQGHMSTESIPLNIGYLACYVKKKLNIEINFELFNLPVKLEKAFERKIPDILACSNYSWNSRLNYFYLSFYKKKFPGMATVMGGPEYPGTEKLQIQFLKEYTDVDFYVVQEGEIAFLNLVKKLVETDFDITAAKQNPIKGCHFLKNTVFINGGSGERVVNLDDIPSPYLEGIFNKMLDDGLIPIIQTNRGCPFKCAYCLTNSKYYNRSYQFSNKRAFDELEKVAQRAKTQVLHITNDNFGIFDEDLAYAEKLAECRKKYGWPNKIVVATSKVRRENVKNCLSLLSDAIYYTASVQSLHENTLKAIRRKNLAFEEQKEILSSLRDKGVKASCEIILGLPEETRESHLQGIKNTLDANIEFLGFYTCILLKNTPLAEHEAYSRYKMIEKYRVICRDFGIYLGKGIMEIEKVCVGTKDLSLEDYIYLRTFHFVITCFYNMEILGELVQYLRILNISIFDWLLNLYGQIRFDKGKAGKILKQFIRDARFELWDSKEELLEYYDNPENFQKLLNGKDGANLLQKYTVIFLDNLSFFIKLCEEITIKKYPEADPLAIKDLLRFCYYRKGKLFDASLVYKREAFNFDIPEWEKQKMKRDIKNFKAKISLDFYMDKEQKHILRKYLGLYGKKQDSRGKVFARVNFYSLYRKFSKTGG